MPQLFLGSYARGFQVALESEGTVDTSHPMESVGYMAFQHARGSLGGDIFQADNTDNRVTSDLASGGIAFCSGFRSPPLFFASIASYNGGDAAELRLSQPTTADQASVFIEEETCADEEQEHVPEVVSYLAIGHSRQHKISAIAQAPPTSTVAGAGVDCGGPAAVNGPTGSDADWAWAPDTRSPAQVCQDSIVDTLDDLNTVCCADQECNGDTFPSRCNEDCAGLWEPMWQDCAPHVSEMFAGQQSMANSLADFSDACDATLYSDSCPRDYYEQGLTQLETQCPGAPNTASCNPSCKKFFTRFFSYCEPRMPLNTWGAFKNTCDQAPGRGGGH